MYKKYGCKKESFLKVTVPWSMFFSTPQPIDANKALELTKKQQINVSVAGVFVNIVFAILTGIPLLFMNITSEVNIILLYLLCVFNLAEASSYLLINNIFLASDMKLLAKQSPKLRLVGLIIGVIVSAALTYFITLSPQEIMMETIIATVTIVLCMSGGRIVFERKNK